MTNNLKIWLQYYRASLIDTSRGKRVDFLGDSIIRDSFKLISFSKEEVDKIWNKYDEYYLKKVNITNKNSNTVEFQVIKLNKNEISSLDFKVQKLNKIEIAPIFIEFEKDHSVSTSIEKDDNVEYPYWVPAYLGEDGTLYPPKEDETPIFLREYLSPNPKDRPTIAEMSKLDSEEANYNFNRDSWSEYWKDCAIYFTKITEKRYSDFQKNTETDLSQKSIKFRLCKYKNSNITRNIINLYNYLINLDESTLQKTLLEKLLSSNTISTNIETTSILVSNHYGHMGEEFPLSKSQREAFAKYQNPTFNDIFAINGPPGTGKTTILQSFIANSLVNAVLLGVKTPLIIGCSTNNQAITNILDSMKLENKNKKILQERWIESVSSFGLYLTNKEENKYQIIKDFNTGFVRDIEYSHSESYFISQFLKYIKENLIEITNVDFNIHKAKELLKKLILKCKEEIDSYLKASINKQEIPSFLKAQKIESEEKLTILIEKVKELIHTQKKIVSKFNRNKTLLEEKHNSFPFYIKYFPFPNFKRIKENAFKLIVREELSFYQDIAFYKYYEVQSATDSILLKEQDKLDKLESTLKKLYEINSECEKRNKIYNTSLEKWKSIYQEKWENLVNKTKDEYQGLSFIEDMNVKLDISLRHKLFWLCVHYREAEFIEELSSNTSDEKESISTKMRRIAKLTPLFISTFHTLPKFCKDLSYGKGNIFIPNLFDLMIVDEAGQVSPEVAIPSFFLTKKALIVGDIHQIEPIWGIVPTIDRKNLEQYNVINNEKDFIILSQRGYLACDGSVMKIALDRTPFFYKAADGSSQKGTLLREHRRCLDDIIAFAQKNVYNNSLILLGGKNHNKKHLLPKLGYLHIDGICEKYFSSSRNIIEANILIHWLKNNEEELTSAYKKTLDEIIAIVTPYSAQKEYLKELVKNHFPETIAEKIIIGTVHALQGAERPIILFSPVNSDPMKPAFMNYGGKINMLNVATTRAKHSFIVFGNMNIFQEGQKTPSSYLAELLYNKKENELDNNFIFSENILFTNIDDKVLYLNTLDEHRNALKECFRLAEKHIIICSPFISINAIKKDNILELIKNVITKGIKVTIITDENFDKQQNGSIKNISLEGREELKNSGANLIVYKQIHSKSICVDDRRLIEGSFNWLSASRDEKYANRETSLVLEGNNASKYIKNIKKIFSIE